MEPTLRQMLNSTPGSVSSMVKRLESGGLLVDRLERILAARAALEQHVASQYEQWADDAAKQLLDTGLWLCCCCCCALLMCRSLINDY